MFFLIYFLIFNSFIACFFVFCLFSIIQTQCLGFCLNVFNKAFNKTVKKGDTMVSSFLILLYSVNMCVVFVANPQNLFLFFCSQRSEESWLSWL